MKKDKKGQKSIQKEKKGFVAQVREQGLWHTMKTLFRRNATMQFVFRFFVLGLLFQFFAHTLVTFKWGVSDTGLMKIVWLWKELFIVVLVCCGLWSLISGGKRGVHLRQTIEKDHIFQILALMVILVINISLLGTYVTHVGLLARAIAAKYNIFPMVIALVWYVIGRYQGRERIMKQLNWVAQVVSYLLVWSLIFYVIVGLKPTVLRHFGYNPYVYEGVVGQAPPATYLALYDYGNTRNQFLFERPITWGFYLVMMFPLFFLRYLRRRALGVTWGWWLLYALAIAVTFSRAARGVWLMLLVLVLTLTYRRWKHFAIALGVGAFAVFALMNMYGGRLLIRDFSDKGHLYALQDSLSMIGDKSLWGHGAGSAGPASHQLHETGFNPENQFLQVMIEYGLVGFLPWLVFFGILLSQGLIAYMRAPCHESIIKKHPQTIYPRYVVVVMLGLLGLCIEGLVLHSFADRMVIYPLMAMVGMVVGAYSIKSSDR